LEELASVPAFELGGVANASVRVTRQFGEVSIWSDTVEITMPEGSFLPEHFPLPMRGRDVRLGIRENVATVEGGTFHGIAAAGHGPSGSATVEATAPLRSEMGLPRIVVRAAGMPINDLLCNAVPDLTLGEPGSPTLPEALRDLRMAGRFDAVADIRGREDGRLGLDLVVTLGGVVARPGRTGQPGPGDLALDDVGGTISLSEDRLIRVDLRGVAGSVAASDEEIVSLSVDAASAEATGAAPEPDPGPRNRSGRLAVTV